FFGDRTSAELNTRLFFECAKQLDVNVAAEEKAYAAILAGRFDDPSLQYHSCFPFLRRLEGLEGQLSQTAAAMEEVGNMVTTMRQQIRFLSQHVRSSRELAELVQQREKEDNKKNR
ncbi:MAG: hypothetical protein AAB853_00065, partial [Patescibacteria group bacterium]